MTLFMLSSPRRFKSEVGFPSAVIAAIMGSSTWNRDNRIRDIDTGAGESSDAKSDSDQKIGLKIL